MSFLVEQAGGLALTGRTRIMDLIPKSVHQRVPSVLGSRDDVAELRRYYEASDDPEILARCEARAAAPGDSVGGAVATTGSSNGVDVRSQKKAADGNIEVAATTTIAADAIGDQ